MNLLHDVLLFGTGDRPTQKSDIRMTLHAVNFNYLCLSLTIESDDGGEFGLAPSV
jgi:hypothetical protein